MLIKWLHLLFVGTTIFQLAFMLVQWFVFKRKEYLYYITYIFSGLVYLAFRIDTMLPFMPFKLPVALVELLDQPLVIFSFWMYIRFGYFFLELKNLQPKVYKAALRLEWFCIIFISVRCLLIPVQLNYQASSYFFLFCVLIFISLAFPVIIRLIAQKNILNNYLVLGSLFITIGGASGPIVAPFLPDMGQSHSVTYLGFEIGILVELFLLNTGLVIKNKLAQAQIIKAQQDLINQFKQTEKIKNRLNTMQTKLSSDLHDNIGAGLSSISMYAAAANKKIVTQHEAASHILQKISSTAIEVIAEMKDTIWFLQPSHSYANNLAERLRQYAEPLCMEQGVIFSCFNNANIPWADVDIIYKKNVLLMAKEAINNALKYASPRHISLCMDAKNENEIQLKIEDDGIGFLPQQKNETGNGLKNMADRCKEINGQLVIESTLGKGTTILVGFSLTTIGE